MNEKLHIVVLTGAGVSAESGIATFRDAQGLWSKYDVAEVSTPEGFARNPDLVHEFYNIRRAGVLEALPNPAHGALSNLEEALKHDGHQFTLITQNVDDLHLRAGSVNVLSMHGEILKVHCTLCGHASIHKDDLFAYTPCKSCQTEGGLRPDIVWFGEMPRYLDQIDDAMNTADLFVSIGTSGSVYPAAGLVSQARENDIETLELNLEPSDNAHLFSQGRYGQAGNIVPAWCSEIIARIS